MIFNRLLWFICVGLIPSIVPAQTPTRIDSIQRSVQKARDYDSKIDMLQKGIKEIYATDFDGAIALARLGHKLANQRNDTLNSGDFLRSIGLALGKKGNIDSASVYYYQALDKLEPTKNPEKLGLLYDDMARMYRKLRQSERALEFYDKALALYEAENDLEGIARINNESGVVFRDEGDYAEANKRFEKSLRIQRQRNDSVGIGYSLEFLGYNQLLIKDYRKSETYLRRALAIREKLGDDFATMLNFTALGEFYKETKQYSRSNEYFQKSNAVAKKISFPDIQRYNYQQIMGNYEAVNNFEQAYQNLKAFNLLNDSLYNADKLKNIEEITTKYETAEKEKHILEQRAKITNRNFWIFGLAALAVIVGLAGFLLYKQQLLSNIKQRQENELKLAMGEIETHNRLQEQRLSISKDLHDNIGSHLTFIISSIDTLRKFMENSEPKISERLGYMSSFAKETIRELRDTIWAMNRPNISIEDLKSRIANFIESANQATTQTALSFTDEADDDNELLFNSKAGMNIYRILQEAVNNALKHADATRVDIGFAQQGDEIQMRIADNGKGFDKQETHEGNGLQNMKARAGALEGTLHISTDNGLTQVECRFPLQANQPS